MNTLSEYIFLANQSSIAVEFTEAQKSLFQVFFICALCELPHSSENLLQQKGVSKTKIILQVNSTAILIRFSATFSSPSFDSHGERNHLQDLCFSFFFFTRRSFIVKIATNRTSTAQLTRQFSEKNPRAPMAMFNDESSLSVINLNAEYIYISIFFPSLSPASKLILVVHLLLGSSVDPVLSNEAWDSQKLDGGQSDEHRCEQDGERALGRESRVGEGELVPERFGHVDVDLVQTDGLDEAGELGWIDFVALARPDGKCRIVGLGAAQQLLQNLDVIGGKAGAHGVSYRLVHLLLLDRFYQRVDLSGEVLAASHVRGRVVQPESFNLTFIDWNLLEGV